MAILLTFTRSSSSDQELVSRKYLELVLDAYRCDGYISYTSDVWRTSGKMSTACMTLY